MDTCGIKALKMIEIVSYPIGYIRKEFKCEKCKAVWYADETDYITDILDGGNGPQRYIMYCPVCNYYNEILSTSKYFLGDHQMNIFTSFTKNIF